MHTKLLIHANKSLTGDLHTNCTNVIGWLYIMLTKNGIQGKGEVKERKD